MRSCRCRNREGRHGVSPGWWLQCEGRIPPLKKKKKKKKKKKTLPSFSDILSWQAGVAVDIH
jgi:hypothetical protein